MMRINLENPDDRITELCSDLQVKMGIMEETDPELGNLNCSHCPIKHRCPYFIGNTEYEKAERAWVNQLIMEGQEVML